MTPDIDAIRQALAAATPGPWHAYPSGVNLGPHWNRTITIHYGNDIGPLQADHELIANAPVWLTQLCDEITELREAFELLRGDRIFELAQVSAERDAALADKAELHIAHGAALAECERLRIERGFLADLKRERSAWRACADQLAADLQWMFDSWIEGGYTEGGDEPYIDRAAEALAVYKRLKGQG